MSEIEGNMGDHVDAPGTRRDRDDPTIDSEVDFDDEAGVDFPPLDEVEAAELGADLDDPNDPALNPFGDDVDIVED